MIEAQESLKNVETSPLKNVETSLETAINTIQSLTHAKQVLSSYISQQKSLAQENNSMKSVVKDLRDEKLQLELEVQEIKKNLQYLQCELKETNNAVLNQARTNNSPHTTLMGEMCQSPTQTAAVTPGPSQSEEEELLETDEASIVRYKPEAADCESNKVEHKELELELETDEAVTSIAMMPGCEDEEMNEDDQMSEKIVKEALKQLESEADDADETSIAILPGCEDEESKQMSEQLVLCAIVEPSQGEEREPLEQPAQSEANEACITPNPELSLTPMKITSPPPPQTNTVTEDDNEDEQMGRDAVSDASQTPSHSVPITPQRIIFDMPLQCDEVALKVTASTRKRCIAKKAYWSPKKWRRMVRDNRLQSLFIENMN